MKDISIYFSPVQIDAVKTEGTIGNSIEIHTEGSFPEMLENNIAIIYVPEFRNGDAQFHGKQHDDFRTYLYSLFNGVDWVKTIYDCGTILPGKEIEDTYFAVSQVTSELVKNNIIPIIVGGTQDLTFAMYKGYEKLEQMINICSVDHKLDLGNPDEAIS